MSGLEERLRELLDQRAEDAASGSAVRMPAEVRARVRRRQALTAVLSGVTLVAIVFLSVIGTRAILKPEMIGEPGDSAGRPFTVFDPPIRVAEGRFRLASGVASGESWNLLAYRVEPGISLEVMAPSNGGTLGAGFFTVPEERDLETTTAWVGTKRNHQIIFGAVVQEAADVHLESKDGRTIRGVVISLPESLLPTFDVVVIQVSRRVSGDIVVTDEEGQQIARVVYLPAPPPEPDPEVVEISPRVTFSPPRGVRGAELRVTVEGLNDYPGAQVDLGLATKDGTWGQGVGSEQYRVDDNGRLEAAITVPGVLAHEHQVVPGEYRMSFGVKPLSPESFSFEETLEVIAAAVGEKYAYPHTPPYECLEYIYFDGRLWRRESGNLTTPVAGSTIELVASDRAVYMTPEGKTLIFRVANPTAIDPDTYRCPPA
jgi:hypothetical protein